jgi:predicted RNA binding protein YcfA (HicA-like mRNA interferase family)
MGWVFIKAEGSHYKMKKGEEIEIIPFHTKELKKGIQEYLLKRIREVG